MTQATLNGQTATGHQVLAAVGKKMLRSGGRNATEQLFTWANFQPGETVLELASSFDYSAIALAQRYGVRVVGTLVHDRLKPDGRFLSHELLARNRADEIHQTLARTIRANTTPCSESTWIELCTAAGLTVERHQTDVMGLLNPRQMVQDEGWIGVGRILWNLATHPVLRQRVLAMRRTFQQYRKELGYIIICAQRN